MTKISQEKKGNHNEEEMQEELTLMKGREKRDVRLEKDKHGTKEKSEETVREEKRNIKDKEAS